MLTKEPLRLPYQAVEGKGSTEGFTSLIIDDLVHQVLDNKGALIVRSAPEFGRPVCSRVRTITLVRDRL